MAERRNGNVFNRYMNHGNSQRGVAATPRFSGANDPIRSRYDKRRLQELYAQKVKSPEALSDTFGNKALPVHAHKQEIIETIEHNKAVILGGPTGSGKSTQVPQYLYEAGYDKTYVLVPRRIIADGLHERIIEEMSEHLGEAVAAETVGVVHGDRADISDENRIVIMTPNTFVRMEADIRKRYSDKKVAIISDEIHEANLYTEIATGVAAQAVHEQDTWRLVAASATHNTKSLSRSFEVLNGGDVPAIEIEGRPFDVDIQEAPEESPMQVYARVGEQHTKTMIFTSGKREIDHIIEETKRVLEEKEPGSSQFVEFRKLHGELNDVEMAHINDPVPEGHRVVIVSSPAGMSGITIPGVTLVVSDGTINRSELDKDGASGLRRHYLSQAEVIQQMGRAGRDVAGGVGILAQPTRVLEDVLRSRGKEPSTPGMEFSALRDRDPFGPPEIYHSNLSQVVLSVSALLRRFADINSFMPNGVEPSDIVNAEEVLARLGALDDLDTITAMGMKMSLYPVRPELARGMAEAATQSRSLQHLARLAIIVAAVEAGGLQNFTDTKTQNWKELLRPTTGDDIIAQLDIALSVDDIDGGEYLRYLDEHDLSYRRTERMKKVTKKILQTVGVRRENMHISVPTPDEESDLRLDLTVGMLDFVYEQSERVNKKQYYQNIHSYGNDQPTQRHISDRSLVGQQHKYVVGFPRYYTIRKPDGDERHDIIELNMPVDPVVVGEYARRNDLLEKRPADPLYDSAQGRVVERYQPMFGSIAVGALERGASSEVITKKAQGLLVHHVLQSPGRAQLAFRRIADELEFYSERIPAEELEGVKNPSAPAFLTKQFIEKKIREIAAQTTSANDVDQRLAEYMYKANIGMHQYFTDEAREWLQERSPSEIVVASTPVRILYDKGQPYITKPRSSVLEEISGTPLLLEDGREVLVQVSGAEGMYRVSASVL